MKNEKVVPLDERGRGKTKKRPQNGQKGFFTKKKRKKNPHCSNGAADREWRGDPNRTSEEGGEWQTCNQRKKKKGH